jgi:hypothetical protein
MPGKEFVDRRTKACLDTGRQLVALGMKGAGFSPKTNILLFKVFVRSKLEAGLPLLLPRQLLFRRLEAVQRTVVARMMYCSGNSSGPILLSLCNLPRMEFRHKFLRSRFVQRVTNLPENHILKQMSRGADSYFSKLSKDAFASEQVQQSRRRASLLPR